MLTYELFSGLSFPYRIQTKSNGVLISESLETLFDAPTYPISQKDFWSSINEAGWCRCPSGYAVYACSLSPNSDELLIIHGLKINGISTAQGRSGELTIRLDRKKLEDYVKNFLIAMENANSRFNSMLAESIHEVRTVNSALYNAAYELQNRLTGQGNDGALSKNITSLSELISQRMELMDFFAAHQQQSAVQLEIVPVFRKFDKLYKCFKALAKSRNIDLQIDGASHRSVKATCHFELIPLLLLDNAVKYSPDNKKISISIIEIGSEIKCQVSSIGPLVKDDERERIFMQGERGEFAKKTGSSGSGIGLYFLKTLVNSAGGEIYFSQGGDISLNIKGVPYRETEFSLIFPMAI